MARQNQASRLDFLDGLRGWGAVVVLLCHAFSDGLPIEPKLGKHLAFWLPFNGTMAVLVFFVVSGFSLSVKYLETGDVGGWIKIAAGRYLRLAIPIFAACALVHIAIVTGLLDLEVERLERFREFLKLDPTLAHLFSFSFFDVFFGDRIRESYIPPLWTMSIELLGSCVVLATILLARPFGWRSLALVLAASGVGLFAPTVKWQLMGLFLAGIVLADAYNRGWFERIPVYAGAALIAVGWFIPLFLVYSVFWWGIVGACSLTVGCIAVPTTRRWLSGTVSRELGRISFPLYLVHAPVIWIVGEPLTRTIGHSIASKFAIDMLVVLLSFALAYAFAPVNTFAMHTSRVFGKWLANLFISRSPVTQTTAVTSQPS